MTKKKIQNIKTIDGVTRSVDGVTIGELEPLSTAQIKDTDLIATETDLSTNSFSVGQVKQIVSDSILAKTNSQLGSIVFHPAPAGYQNIPVEINGFGDAILVADGRLINKTDYLDFWNFVKVRKDKGIYGFNGETSKSFKIDDFTDKITLPNLLTGDAVYMGKYGLQNAIFPQHTFTSGNIQPIAQPHNHTYSDSTIKGGAGNRKLAPDGGDGLGDNGRTTSTSNININPFTVSSSSISGLPSGITIGNDLKVAGVKMIPCIVVKPVYNIIATQSSGTSGDPIITKDLDMNQFKVVNLGAPVNPNDAVRLVDIEGKGDLQSDRSKLLVGAGVFNSKQVVSMDDLKDSNIIVGDSARAITTLANKLNSMDIAISLNTGNLDILDHKAIVNDGSMKMKTNYIPTSDYDVTTKRYVDDLIATGGTGIKPRMPVIVQIPIIAQTLNANAISNIRFGTPFIVGNIGTDYLVNNYLVIISNLQIQFRNKEYNAINFSCSLLADFVDNNGNPVTNGTKYYQVMIRRGSLGGNAIIDVAHDIKTDNTSIADASLVYTDSFSSGPNDPFNTDSILLSLDNVTTNKFKIIETRAGYTKPSCLRIKFS